MGLGLAARPWVGGCWTGRCRGAAPPHDDHRVRPAESTTSEQPPSSRRSVHLCPTPSQPGQLLLLLLRVRSPARRTAPAIRFHGAPAAGFPRTRSRSPWACNASPTAPAHHVR